MNTKYVEHNFKVYVGDVYMVGVIDFCGNGSIAPDPFCPPHKFFEVANNISCDVYSNNMCLVRFFKPQHVICVSNGICKSLDQHPKFEKWKDEMDSGEMVSLFGYKWVENQT